MLIEKSGIIEEQDLRKSMQIIFEFSNKISKLNIKKTKHSIYFLLLILFFAIIKSIDESHLFNIFWIGVGINLSIIGFQVFIFNKVRKKQMKYIEEHIKSCLRFSKKDYNYSITDEFIFNRFGDIETKYPISLLETCYIYKQNFIFFFKVHFNQLLLFSFDSFTREEFEVLYSFLNEKGLLDKKYDIVTFKKDTIKVDLTKELHEK